MNHRAHAKINLSLTVCALRTDGYHELKTVFQSLALHDTLRFASADEGLALTCSSPDVPLDAGNLVWKAARMVWDAAGRRGQPRGRVRITKRIPARGGLGGGSADGAAALVGWNSLWNTRLPDNRLRELARGLGADVPFFLCAGTALGVNRGDEIHPMADAPSRWVVLVVPPFGVSTPEAFRWWDEDQARLAGGDAPTGLRIVPSLPRDDRRRAAVSRVTAIAPRAASGESLADLPAVFNDLEGPVSRRHPELSQIRRRLERAGAEAAAMTGSGSTVFGLFSTRDRATAACADLRVAGWCALVTRTATRRQAALRPLSESAALV
jgi:4-diphosphocytidyl-2-C-methyl-D-erythritol kinase